MVTMCPEEGGGGLGPCAVTHASHLCLDLSDVSLVCCRIFYSRIQDIAWLQRLNPDRIGAGVEGE